MTGRGAGYCAGNERPGSENPSYPRDHSAYRRGAGRGNGRSRGRGRRR
ncbi:MAG: DUF5320 family protein [Bacillota bacterium]